MTQEDDDIAAKDAAPNTPGEWRTIRSGVDKAHKSWVIVGPIHAAVTNWKALAIAVAVIVYLNRPDIIAALSTLVGVGK